MVAGPLAVQIADTRAASSKFKMADFSNQSPWKEREEGSKKNRIKDDEPKRQDICMWNFCKQAKAAQKMIRGNSSEQTSTALLDQEGETCSDPGDLKQIVQDYFQKLARPMHGSRNGIDMPDEVHREYL